MQHDGVVGVLPPSPSKLVLHVLHSAAQKACKPRTNKRANVRASQALPNILSAKGPNPSFCFRGWPQHSQAPDKACAAIRGAFALSSWPGSKDC